MFPGEKSSPFASIRAAVLTLALGGGWFALHRSSTPPSPEVVKAPDGLLPLVSDPATLEQAGQYFVKWGGYVVWANDLAEFALWSPKTRDDTQFFEVRRAHGQFTFRRIAQLTPAVERETGSSLASAPAKPTSRSTSARAIKTATAPSRTPRASAKSKSAGAASPSSGSRISTSKWPPNSSKKLRSWAGTGAVL